MTNTNNQMISLSAPNNSVAAITSDLFRDIDFKGISQAIENIGNHNGTLGVEEKEMASELVAQWEQDVVTRLRDKGHEMNEFVQFFNTGYEGRVSQQERLEDIGADLAAKTNTYNEYTALVQTLEDLEDLHQQRPIQPIEREDRTYKEKLEEEKKFQLDMAKYNLAVTKKNRELYQYETAWKKLLKQNKEVAELIKKAKEYNKSVSKFQQNCHDKAQVAKLNIMISNQDVRQSLRELLDFTGQI